MQRKGTTEGGGGEAAAGSNRPENSKFKQQKLDAWQPILTPAWVIGTFVVVGIVFVPVGVYLFQLSRGLFESSVTYDSYLPSEIAEQALEKCQIDSLNQGYEELRNGTRELGTCTLEFEFTQDIAVEDTVYVYYQISNFYQNHRRYVKSVSESQLMDEVQTPTLTTDSSANTDISSLSVACEPSQSFTSSFEDRIFYPCGLIALSVFNDGISLASFERDGETANFVAGYAPADIASSLNVSISKDNIAWPSDLQNKYRNPVATDCALDLDNPGGNLCPLRYFQYQFLWQTYDQFVCYPRSADDPGVPNITAQSTCLNYTEYVNNLGREEFGPSEWDAFVQENSEALKSNKFFGDGCADCNEGDLLVFAGGIRRPPADEVEDPMSQFGVRDEGFVSWMRTAGLPTFRKLYGRLEPPTGGFKKGDKVSFSVTPNFLVSTIEGSKAIVLGTTSPLGGKNDILGIAYMTVGAICLFLALLFFIKLKVHPRKLGDPQYLHWKKK